jgi:hypothetical protein
VSGDAVTKIDIPSVDILRRAVTEVLARFQKTQSRRPNIEEWEGLLTAAVDREELGVVKAVRIDVAYDDDTDDD